MRKMLIGLFLSSLACGVIATATAQTPRPPVERAQALPPARQMPPMARGGAERRGRRCENVYALAAGRLAYLEVRLNLAGAQTAAFARWRETRLAAARQRAETCATGPQAGRGAATGPVERLTRQEARLQNRLANIQAERPALEALYNTLSPDQRQSFARTARMGGGMMRGRMMMRRGLMRDGPRGPMGRGAPDAPPPPG